MRQQAVALDGAAGSLRGHVFNPDGRGPLVVLFRGVAFARPAPDDPGYQGLAREIADAGFTVLFVSFRGTDDSDGFFSMRGWAADARLVMDYAFTLGYDTVALVGASAGAATGLRYAALEGGVDAVASLASPGLLRETFDPAGTPGFMARVRRASISPSGTDSPEKPEGFYDDLVAHDPYPVIDRVSPIPLLIMQGDDDQFVTVATARALFEAAGEPKELIVIHSAGHVLRTNPSAVAALVQWLKYSLGVD